MSQTAFSPSLSAIAPLSLFLHSSTPLCPHRRSPPTTTRRRRRRSPPHIPPSCSIPSRLPSDKTASAVEIALRSLGADSAADSSYVLLASSPLPLPSTWPAVLSALSSAGINGDDLSRIVLRAGAQYLLALPAKSVSAVLALLRDLGFTRAQLVRVLAQRPALLADVDEVSRRVEILRGVHFSDKDIRNVAAKWPGLLAVNAERALRVVDFLCTEEIGFTRQSLKSLVRRAPWVLVYDVEEHVAPAIRWLQREVVVFKPDGGGSLSLERVIRASPHVIGMSPSAMGSVMSYLREDLLLDEDRILSVVRQFPPVLTSSVADVLRPAGNFLFRNLGLGYEEVGRLVRAFPAILTLSVADDLQRNYDYLRSRGFSNIGRIVVRLPPVLSYDVETNLAPKMDFLENAIGLTAYDVTLFPGFFSYSLTDVIEPRTRFLQKVGVPVTEVGLNMALTTTDAAFCSRVAVAPLSHYVAFRTALAEKRAQLVSSDSSAPILADPKLQPSVENRVSQLDGDGSMVAPMAASAAATEAKKQDDGQSPSYRGGAVVSGRDKILPTPFERSGSAGPDLEATIVGEGEVRVLSATAPLPRSLRPVNPPKERRRKRRLRATDARLPWSEAQGPKQSVSP